jgi:hypothetical protein
MDDLQGMLIERACARLIAQYCHLIDGGEASRVGELFANDGVWASAETTMTGQAEITRAFRRREADKGRISRHVCANILIDVIAENQARGVCCFTLYRHDGELGRARAPSMAPTMIGEYLDQFVRTAEGWRIRRRDVVVNFGA